MFCNRSCSFTTASFALLNVQFWNFLPDGIFTKLSKLPGVQYGDSKIEKSLNREWKSTLYSEVNEGFFFHGTKAERVQGVIKQGLDARMAQGEAVFGQALYMAESSTKADQYTGIHFNKTSRIGHDSC
jgi:hypothetical protein